VARLAHVSCPAQRRRAGDLAVHAGSWGRALASGQASLSIPCFAERRYGRAPDDKLLMALPSDDLPKANACLQALAADSQRSRSRNTTFRPTRVPGWAPAFPHAQPN